MGDGKAALVLTGGGARAAYQVGVLQAIRDLLPDPAADDDGRTLFGDPAVQRRCGHADRVSHAAAADGYGQLRDSRA